MKRGKIGPGVCCLCMKGGDDNDHLFYGCSFAKNVLRELGCYFNISFPVFENTMEFILWGKKKYKNYGVLPALFHWFIWLNRNKVIFYGVPGCFEGTTNSIISLWSKLKTGDKPPMDLSKRLRPFEIHYPAGFFDEASQHLVCGCGAWLLISPHYHYKIHQSGGRGSNTRAEILALWGLFWFASQLYVDNL